MLNSRKSNCSNCCSYVVFPLQILKLMNLQVHQTRY